MSDHGAIAWGIGLFTLLAGITLALIRVFAYVPYSEYDSYYPLENNTGYAYHSVIVPAHTDWFTAGIIVAISAGLFLLIMRGTK